jgi:hypothetical protein
MARYTNRRKDSTRLQANIESTTNDIETKVDTIDGFHDVPSADSSNNSKIRDVVGNKSDDALLGPGSSSLYLLAGYMGYYHVHSPSICYPRDADSATLTAVNDGNTWSEGSKVEIIPVNTINDPFDIHFVLLGDISANSEYVVKLYYGGVGSETFWGECAFTRDTNKVRGSQIPIQGPPVPANARISASLLSENNNGETVDIKLYTHSYP